MNWIYDPWPWYVAGPLIALTMFILLFCIHPTNYIFGSKIIFPDTIFQLVAF